jgi:phage tail-like protein
MDPNGARFHLLRSRRDWDGCREELPGGGLAAPGTWVHLKRVDSRSSADRYLPGQPPSGQTAGCERVDQACSIRLEARLPLFRRRTGNQPLRPQGRRGAAADGDGNRFWIGADRRGIWWQPSGGGLPALWWGPDASVPAATPGFAPVSAPGAPPELSGLAITTRDYLAAGVAGGLLLFDLSSGGPPTHLTFPSDLQLHPWDLAADADGGLWVLDRLGRRLYGLDCTFRLRAVGELRTEPGPVRTPVFGPLAGSTEAPPQPQVRSVGIDLAMAEDPIAIEAMPNAGALILDAAPAQPSARLLIWHTAALGPLLPLLGPTPDDGSERLRVHAIDLAYDPEAARVYALDAWGRQAIAFDLGLAPPSLTLRRDFLPLHSHGGRGFMVSRKANAISIHYDLAPPENRDDSVRWAPLVTLDEEGRFESRGVLLSPVFDGRGRDCVWDGLFLDACIPAGTTLLVSSRVHNERDLVETQPFQSEPPLYLRGLGAELPFYDPFADEDPRPAKAGTWELLLQQAEGRYLQLRLDLQGNGGASPRIRGLRVYYPRFSYTEHYLPALYREDAQSADFLERLLSNLRGIYDHVESHIGEARSLFDPRTAPPEVLDWLAGWLGLLLDPLWGELSRYSDGASAADRRRLLIRFAPRLFERRGTPSGIRLALHLLLDPGLESILARFRAAALAEDTALRVVLTRYGLPYPTPYDDAETIDDLFCGYLLAPERPSQIRLSEGFATLASGSEAEAQAHHFTVLVPSDLAAEQIAMVRRIVGIEKPAHTDFDLYPALEGFRVGRVRLGLDTLLGRSGAFGLIELGQQALPDGYLAAAPPMDDRQRLVLNRDRLGDPTAL